MNASGTAWPISCAGSVPLSAIAAVGAITVIDSASASQKCSSRRSPARSSITAAPFRPEDLGKLAREFDRHGRSCARACVLPAATRAVTVADVKLTILLAAAWALAGCGSRPVLTAQHTNPTIVIEHGAFTDASGWDDVVSRLRRRGYTVLAPPNPLRGVAADAAYLKSILTTIKAPIVLVGHSYGGAVITNAATS